MDLVDINSADAAVKWVCPPTVITLHCKNVLELGDEFHQNL
jgi:hypothetical protein